MLNGESRSVTEPIKILKNPFYLLKYKESNIIHSDIVDDSNTTNKNPFRISDSNITEIQNHVKTQNDLKNRSSVVINHFPENQFVFRKIRAVPGENFYSAAVKCKMNNINIKIFSNSIAEGTRVRQFNQIVKTRNARIHSFSGTTSWKLLHYLDVNLESATDTVILHKLTIISQLINNVEHMVKQWNIWSKTGVFIWYCIYRKKCKTDS